MTQRTGNFLFRQRGLLVALLAIYSLYYAQPNSVGLYYGFTWALLGESLRLWAIGYSGEPTRSQTLDAPVLVTAGPYAYVRNPLYLGNLLNSMGVLIAAFYPWNIPAILILGSGVTLLYLFLGKHEEKFLTQVFGTEYEEYQQHVPAWWPKLRGYQKTYGCFCLKHCLKFERSSLIWWCLIWLILIVKGW